MLACSSERASTSEAIRLAGKSSECLLLFFTPHAANLYISRYVLSTTHLHEFKSADKGQAPVMSLYLPEQKLGSHSSEGGSSNKFILKGRQTGAMHRGHTWVFRAESHDTMMAWYEDIKVLTEKTPEERNQFVRHHSRSLSQSSRRSASSDGGLVDDEDEEPFSADSHIDVNPGPKFDTASRRSQSGGRFPSDIQVNAQRGLQASQSPSSLSSGGQDQQPSDFQTMAAAGALPGSGFPPGPHGEERGRQRGYGELQQSPIGVPAHATIANQEAQNDGVNPYTSEPLEQRHQATYQPERTYVAPVVIPAQQSQQQRQYESSELSDDVDEPKFLAGGPIQSSTGYDQYDQSRDQVNGSAVGPNVHVLATTSGAGYRADESAKAQQAPAAGSYFADADGAAFTSGSQTPKRPTGNTTRNDSVNTISNLHIPGGFPRASLA